MLYIRQLFPLSVSLVSNFTMSSLKPFLLLLVALIFCLIAYVDHVSSLPYKTRIIGGRPARPAQFPSQVSLRYLISDESVEIRPIDDSDNGNEGYEDFCGASIISKRWIITAAHCFDAYTGNVTNLLAIVGAVNLDTDGKAYAIERIEIHPDYNEDLIKNDVALVQTSEEIKFSRYVRPIRLSREFIGGDLRSYTAGWGLIGVS